MIIFLIIGGVVVATATCGAAIGLAKGGYTWMD